jgi:hypothetical protein
MDLVIGLFYYLFPAEFSLRYSERQGCVKYEWRTVHFLKYQKVFEGLPLWMTICPVFIFKAQDVIYINVYLSYISYPLQHGSSHEHGL